MDLLRATNTLSAFEWTGEELMHEPIVENRRKIKGEELRRNPDSRLSEVD
jgi:hypothetical protein